jgi:hypothetical protein
MNGPVGAYLAKRADLLRWTLDAGNTEGVRQVVVIPALAEEANLFDTLADLAAAPPESLRHTLVLCVVNNRALPSARAEDIENNQRTLRRLAEWRKHAALRLGVVDASSPGRELPERTGVGLARKIGLDWGLHVLHENGADTGPLISVDADTRVDPDYLVALERFFAAPGRWAAVIDYAHPLTRRGPEAAAIVCYEIFLRYHELALAYAGSPYAFHTIGSTIACTGRAYAAVSGMNRREAGEDFYFLQQLAKTGPVDRLTETVVRPAARASHRVPFGTGRRVLRHIEASEDEYLLYHPASYDILRAWLAAATANLHAPAAVVLAQAREIAEELAVFLKAQGFEEAWTRLQANQRQPEQLRRQFHRWFDGFRTLKLIHHLRDTVYPRQEMFSAVNGLLARVGGSAFSVPALALRDDIEGQKAVLEMLRARCRALPKRMGVV